MSLDAEPRVLHYKLKITYLSHKNSCLCKKIGKIVYICLFPNSTFRKICALGLTFSF
uniref:Uncharacterized protein n=1 Tax=Rhizophora mucronata TaxID=61149 RepID=A0A2P2N5B5_RHIMU